MTKLSYKDHDYHLIIAEQIFEIQEEWQILADKNLLIGSDYMKVMEAVPPKGMQFIYTIIYHLEQPIGIVYHQIYDLELDKSIQYQNEEKSNCLIKLITNSLRNLLIGRAVPKLLISGNLLLTGNYGFHFLDSYKKIYTDLLLENYELVQKYLYAKNIQIDIQLTKDFEDEQYKHLINGLIEQKHFNFYMQPCMKMKIAHNWSSLDEYIDDMQSKYKVRLRRARKKGEELHLIEYDEKTILNFKEEIYQLYQSIADNAGFNAYYLHEDYFYQLKIHLKDKFRFFAYTLNNQLIGFYTIIENNKELNAHFLGLDKQYNRSHQIYLNILYDIVQYGIEHQFEEIDFARTALEIKSSVGAIPYEMSCLIKHRNTLSNKILHSIFERYNPKEAWTPRNPFKDKIPA